MEKEIRVIFFEDNPAYHEVILMELTYPFIVAGAYFNCDKLIQRVEQCQPEIVIMDISMPGLSGIEAISILQDHFPGLPILMLTVFDEDDKIFASLRAGASGYLLKNSIKGKLQDAVTEVLAGGAAFTPVIAKRIAGMFKKLELTQPPEFINLSQREKEVLEYLVKGMSYKMIAAACFVSTETVHSHIKAIYKKLHVNSKSEAVVKALKNQIV